MRAPVWILVMLMLSVILGGCFGAKPATPRVEQETEGAAAPYAPPTPPDFDWSTAIEATHPEGVAGHAVPDSHKGIVGMEPLDFYDLSGGMRYQAMVSGQYNEVDVCGGMAVVGSFAGNRGFTLVNITNTSDIRADAQFASMGLTWDVRFSPDCQTVFVGMENLEAMPSDVPEVPTLPFTGLHDTGRGGVVVVDVSDVKMPARSSYIDMGTVHNLFSFEVDGDTYLVVNTGSIWRLVVVEGTRTLEKVAEVPGSHDVHVMRHPATGVPYLFLDDDGLMIFDVSDPAAPEPVSHLELPEGHSTGHEQTPAPALIDGRWLLVGAGENIGGVPEPFSIVDITDPSEPAWLGGWTLPGDFTGHDPATAFFTFSPHNIAVRDDGRVALANYHAGTWIIDVSTKERQENPVTMGYAFPDPPQNGTPDPPEPDLEVDPSDPTKPAGYVFELQAYAQSWVSPHLIVPSLPYRPFVWGGAWAEDGSLVVADLNSGLYTYRVP